MQLTRKKKLMALAAIGFLFLIGLIQAGLTVPIAHKNVWCGSDTGLRYSLIEGTYGKYKDASNYASSGDGASVMCASERTVELYLL